MTTLEDFNELVRVTNKTGGFHRCGICDAVNSEHIATNEGDYKPHTPFVPDPKDTSHYICLECMSEIEDLRFDYEFEDSENGWNSVKE